MKITLWFLTQVLGWSVTAMSLAGKLAQFLGIPPQPFELKEPYQSAVSILAILFLITMICRSVMIIFTSYENWRHKKISNDERVFNIKQSREKNNNRE